MMLPRLDCLEFSIVGRNSSDFAMLRQSGAKRIRFYDNDYLRDAPDPEGKYIAFFNIPFTETMYAIIKELIPNLIFTKNDNGRFWFGIKDTMCHEKLKKFIRDNSRIVFIKSLLPCTIALDMNFESHLDEYTEIGRHEHNAKENNNDDSLKFVIAKVTEAITRIPGYSKADGIISVPASTGKSSSFPQKIASGVAGNLRIIDFSSQLIFKNKFKSLQAATVEEKWGLLDKCEMLFDGDISVLKNKFLIIVDDLYQSGATLNYTAMFLKKIGLDYCAGLTVVKSRRDDDNFVN